MEVLMDERGSRHHNPDDLTIRPAAFRHYHEDQSVIETFFIHGDWHLAKGSKKIGELIVRHSADGPLITCILDIAL